MVCSPPLIAELAGVCSSKIEHGPHEMPGHQQWPLRGQMVAERDGATRAAVLRALEALYLAEGPEEAWARIGAVSAQQRSLIQERFKYVDRQAQRFAGSRGPSGDGGGAQPEREALVTRTAAAEAVVKSPRWEF